MPAKSLVIKQLLAARPAPLIIACWVLLVHFVAVVLFSSGFLLTRPVLENFSNQTAVPPAFQRAVIIVVDALRYDFVAPQEHDLYYTNKMGLEGGVLAEFIADPPTTTLQRLKGLTTGSLPAFIDAGSNFAGVQILEDNWVSQAHRLGKSVAFVGDDTWESLFSPYFSESLPFPSLNVRDLDTVDRGVQSNLPRLLANESNSIVIGHMLGVDHVGHRYGPNHPSMASKLKETGAFIREIQKTLKKDTILFVMGDHGMDSTGNHGGDSPDELSAALWMWSPALSPADAGSVAQIDFVSTISSLLGMPIPFNNLGFPIKEVFKKRNFDLAVRETAQQISGYAAILGYPEWEGEDPSAYHNMTVEVFRSSWVEFNMMRISGGLILLALSIIACFFVYNGVHALNLWLICRNASIGGATGLVLAAVIVIITPHQSLLNTLMSLGVGAAAGSNSAMLFSSMPFLSLNAKPDKGTLWALLLLSLVIVSGFSNSYVIWEPRVIHFLLATLIVIVGLRTSRSKVGVVQYLGRRYTLTLLVLLRVSAMWGVCREETAVRGCRTTFFESGSSLPPSWTTWGLSALTLSFSYFMKRFWLIGGNDCGIASLILRFSTPVLMFSLTYWTLDGAEARGLLPDLFYVDTVKVLVARIALACGLGLGISIWYANNPCIELNFRNKKEPKIEGYANVYGSYAYLPILVIFWALASVNKPPGTIALATQIYTGFCLLDLLDLADLKYTLAVPVIFDFLGHLFYYSTGHQSTIPSIQWDTAFVASSTVSYFWSPLAVILNTLGPYIYSTLFSVLAATWRRAPFKEPRQLLAYICRAAAGTAFVGALRTQGSMTAAALLRRHLMTWKIFAPRYMLAGICLVASDIVIVVAILVGGHTLHKITKIFG